VSRHFVGGLQLLIPIPQVSNKHKINYAEQGEVKKREENRKKKRRKSQKKEKKIAKKLRNIFDRLPTEAIFPLIFFLSFKRFFYFF